MALMAWLSSTACGVIKRYKSDLDVMGAPPTKGSTKIEKDAW